MASKRRNRKPTSCTICRLRKLKCDKELPCSSCIRYETPSLCRYTSVGFTQQELAQMHAASVAKHSDDTTSTSTVLSGGNNSGMASLVPPAGNHQNGQISASQTMLHQLPGANAHTQMAHQPLGNHGTPALTTTTSGSSAGPLTGPASASASSATSTTTPTISGSGIIKAKAGKRSRGRPKKYDSMSIDFITDVVGSQTTQQAQPQKTASSEHHIPQMQNYQVQGMSQGNLLQNVDHNQAAVGIVSGGRSTPGLPQESGSVGMDTVPAFGPSFAPQPSAQQVYQQVSSPEKVYNYETWDFSKYGADILQVKPNTIRYFGRTSTMAWFKTGFYHTYVDKSSDNEKAKLQQPTSNSAEYQNPLDGHGLKLSKADIRYDLANTYPVSMLRMGSTMQNKLIAIESGHSNDGGISSETYEEDSEDENYTHTSYGNGVNPAGEYNRGRDVRGVIDQVISRFHVGDRVASLRRFDANVVPNSSNVETAFLCNVAYAATMIPSEGLTRFLVERFFDSINRVFYFVVESIFLDDLETFMSIANRLPFNNRNKGVLESTDELVLGPTRFKGGSKVFSIKEEYKQLNPRFLSLLLIVLHLAHITLPYDWTPEKAGFPEDAGVNLSTPLKQLGEVIIEQSGYRKRSDLTVIQVFIALRNCSMISPDDSEGGDGAEGGFHIATLIQLCHTMGVHRDPSNFTNFPKDKHILWRILWASTYIHETKHSLESGIPFAIQLEYSDTDISFSEYGSIPYHKDKFPVTEREYQSLSFFKNFLQYSHLAHEIGNDLMKLNPSVEKSALEMYLRKVQRLKDDNSELFQKLLGIMVTPVSGDDDSIDPDQRQKLADVKNIVNIQYLSLFTGIHRLHMCVYNLLDSNPESTVGITIALTVCDYITYFLEANRTVHQCNSDLEYSCTWVLNLVCIRNLSYYSCTLFSSFFKVLVYSKEHNNVDAKAVITNIIEAVHSSQRIKLRDGRTVLMMSQDKNRFVYDLANVNLLERLSKTIENVWIFFRSISNYYYSAHMIDKVFNKIMRASLCMSFAKTVNPADNVAETLSNLKKLRDSSNQKFFAQNPGGRYNRHHPSNSGQSDDNSSPRMDKQRGDHQNSMPHINPSAGYPTPHQNSLSQDNHGIHQAWADQAHRPHQQYEPQPYRYPHAGQVYAQQPHQHQQQRQQSQNGYNYPNGSRPMYGNPNEGRGTASMQPSQAGYQAEDIAHYQHVVHSDGIQYEAPPSYGQQPTAPPEMRPQRSNSGYEPSPTNSMNNNPMGSNMVHPNNNNNPNNNNSNSNEIAHEPQNLDSLAIMLGMDGPVNDIVTSILGDTMNAFSFQ